MLVSLAALPCCTEVLGGFWWVSYLVGFPKFASHVHAVNMQFNNIASGRVQNNCSKAAGYRPTTFSYHPTAVSHCLNMTASLIIHFPSFDSGSALLFSPYKH